MPYREKCIKERIPLKKNVEESLSSHLPAALIKIVLSYHDERCLTFSEFREAKNNE